MADTTRLRFFTVGILGSDAVKKIDFTLGPHRIDAAGFHRVAAALAFGRIGVEVDPAGLGKLKAGASYDPSGDKLVFPNATMANLDERMHIVHECVHALIDMRGLWWATRSEAEAAAYVAGALYCLYDYGFSASLLDVFQSRPDQSWVLDLKEEPFVTAMRIAQSLKNTKGMSVPVQDAMVLRSALLKQPAYTSINMATLDMADGLR